jgi:hypothetical protein
LAQFIQGHIFQEVIFLADYHGQGIRSNPELKWLTFSLLTGLNFGPLDGPAGVGNIGFSLAKKPEAAGRPGLFYVKPPS